MTTTRCSVTLVSCNGTGRNTTQPRPTTRKAWRRTMINRQMSFSSQNFGLFGTEKTPDVEKKYHQRHNGPKALKSWPIFKLVLFGKQYIGQLWQIQQCEQNSTMPVTDKARQWSDLGQLKNNIQARWIANFTKPFHNRWQTQNNITYIGWWHKPWGSRTGSPWCCCWSERTLPRGLLLLLTSSAVACWSAAARGTGAIAAWNRCLWRLSLAAWQWCIASWSGRRPGSCWNWRRSPLWCGHTCRRSRAGGWCCRCGTGARDRRYHNLAVHRLDEHLVLEDIEE